MSAPNGRQLFPPWTNRLPAIATALLIAGPVGLAGAAWYWFSPEFTDVGYEPEQPVPYSHKLHAGDLGLDCRYCHLTVERAAHAAVPPTQICMSCHEQLFLPESTKLAPVRIAYAKDDPMAWVRVHMLPDYVYFNHSVHMTAGVGCESCHGRVDQMEVVYQAKPLSMAWCLDCHKKPLVNLRPKSRVTDMNFDATNAHYDPLTDPQRTRGVTPPLHCSGCHR